jgi:hypothetical protein
MSAVSVCAFFNHKFLHETLTILDHRIQPLAIALDLDLDATRIVPVGWMSLVNLSWRKFMSVCLFCRQLKESTACGIYNRHPPHANNPIAKPDNSWRSSNSAATKWLCPLRHVFCRLKQECPTWKPCEWVVWRQSRWDRECATWR